MVKTAWKSTSHKTGKWITQVIDLSSFTVKYNLLQFPFVTCNKDILTWFANSNEYMIVYFIDQWSRNSARFKTIR